MPVINNPFNGKMNLDVADYRIDNGDYIDALNITKDAQGVGQDRVVSNILGNTNIPYSLPSGNNKVIGFYPDKIRNRAYYFIYNTNGYNSIVYYDLNNNLTVKVLQSKTDSDGVDILNFNPSYKVTSVNIFYRDDEGDLLFFNDGINPPKYINVTEYHGTSWKIEYILVAKAPPIMPPKVVYENDTTVTINNLRNRLFQFTYRYVYVNNEKSVWSSKSIVPLPQQDTLLLTNDVFFTNNSRISVSVSTGGLDVIGIEISFRETTNSFTSEWFLIKLFNKSDLRIDNNSIFTFNFYNDSLYTQIDPVESSQLQDWVPQKANAAELANGNVLLYSGITESFDKTPMNLIGNVNSLTNGYFFDYCGLLFFATCNGLDSGSSGNVLKVYLFGTGTNTSNIVSTLDNAYAKFVINAVNNSGTDIGISFTPSGSLAPVNYILSQISSLLVAKGWTTPSIINNVLTISYTAGFKLYSSGTILVNPANNTTFANSWNSGYTYAVQYFDYEGRTIGAQNSIDATINTPKINPDFYCQPFLEILNRPPLEAVYYQVLRSNNTTYNKRLFWISKGAYCSTSKDTTTQRFAYIDIINIQEYNEQLTSTVGVVSYNYTQGDRVTFLSRYDSSNINHPIPQQYDYEILGTTSTIFLENGTIQVGNFIKILYPEVANTDPNFSFGALPLPAGTTSQDFLHYEIFLYNYSNNAVQTERLFYEFGKCFGIGNPGTSLAYHIGLDQTQSATNPSGVPAIIGLANGDLFFRQRKVPYNDQFLLSTGIPGQDINSLLQVTVSPLSPVTNTSYIIQTQNYNTNPHFPSFTYTYPVISLFQNLLSTQALTIRLTGQFTAYQSQLNDNTTFNFQVLYIGPDNVQNFIPLFPSQSVQSQVQTPFSIDNVVTIPANAKMWLCSFTENIQSGESFTINNFILNFEVLKSSTINIIESSFIDTYNLVTNSNGRASVIDINAKKTYFPTLIRFGGAYQVDTNINKLNNFIFEDFDEYDRSFGDVIRLHVRERYLKVYQKFKVGNVPILTQIVKDSADNPLQANTNTLINKVQYYAGDYGIGDAATSLAWNNFADYFVDNYRGVVCRLSQDGIVPISITNNTNAFFVPNLIQYRQDLNNGIPADGQPYMGNPCIYGVFDAYTNKYILSLEEINRYGDCQYNGGTAYILPVITTTTTTTTSGPTTTTTSGPTTSTTTTFAPINYIGTGSKFITNCNVPTTSTPIMYLNASDYSIFVNNGNCLSDGTNTVSAIRDVDGNLISGIFNFTFRLGICSYTTFTSTNGVISLNNPQC